MLNPSKVTSYSTNIPKIIPIPVLWSGFGNGWSYCMHSWDNETISNGKHSDSIGNNSTDLNFNFYNIGIFLNNRNNTSRYNPNFDINYNINEKHNFDNYANNNYY